MSRTQTGFRRISRAPRPNILWPVYCWRWSCTTCSSGPQGYHRYARTQSETRPSPKGLDRLNQENLELGAQVRALTTDPRLIEKSRAKIFQRANPVKLSSGFRSLTACAGLARKALSFGASSTFDLAPMALAWPENITSPAVACRCCTAFRPNGTSPVHKIAPLVLSHPSRNTSDLFPGCSQNWRGLLQVVGHRQRLVPPPSSTSSSRPLLGDVLTAFSSSHRGPLEDPLLQHVGRSRTRLGGGRELVVVSFHDMEAVETIFALCRWVANRPRGTPATCPWPPPRLRRLPRSRFQKASKALPPCRRRRDHGAAVQFRNHRQCSGAPWLCAISRWRCVRSA